MQFVFCVGIVMRLEDVWIFRAQFPHEFEPCLARLPGGSASASKASSIHELRGGVVATKRTKRMPLERREMREDDDG